MHTVDIESLICSYGKDIYAFCRKMTNNKDDADELYQQSFLKAWELKHKIRADINPKSFLISLSIGIWRNTVRKRGRRNRIAPETLIEPNDVAYVESAGKNILDSIISAELQSEVRNIVDSLPEAYKIPVIMLYTLEMPVREISQSLKLPQGTVKSRLHKARALIKERLEAKGYGED